MRSVFLDKENKEKFMEGVKKTTDIISSTLGPNGKTVIIETSGGSAALTKDGVKVAKNIEFKCPLEDKGAKVILSVAKKADSEAGDGTTSTTVLTSSLLEKIDAIPASMPKRDIAAGIIKAKKAGIEFIKKHIEPISKPEDLVNVAAISANNNVEMGKIVASAFLDSKNKIQDLSLIHI